MAAGRGLPLLLLLAALLVWLASASPFISDGVFQASAGSTTGRTLLQAKRGKPVICVTILGCFSHISEESVELRNTSARLVSARNARDLGQRVPEVVPLRKQLGLYGDAGRLAVEAPTCRTSSYLARISGAVRKHQNNLTPWTPDCPVNFEFQNYTVITSRCKGPKYPPKDCCDSFKEFACPFNTYINDESNDCASTMFSYINLYGKYPPGLFAHECREGKLGLSCEGVPQKDVVASGVQRAQSSSLALITLMCGLVALFFQ